MSQIRVVYAQEPNFPPADQHPDAYRYYVRADGTVDPKRVEGVEYRYVVDALQGPPTLGEIEAMLNPQPPSP